MGAEVVCARFSEALLAVRTETQLRLLRCEDWKTLISSSTPARRTKDPAIELVEDRSLLISTTAEGLSVMNLETKSVTSLKTGIHDWQLQVMEQPSLLTAQASSVLLRDLDRANLPVVSSWSCNPLGLCRRGALAINSRIPSQALWLDPRQPELTPLNINCSAFVQGELEWTCGAVGSSHNNLAMLGTAGELVALDLRQSKVPLWCLAQHGTVKSICLTSRLVLTEIYAQGSVAGIEANQRFQVASLQGMPLALFTGLQGVASGEVSSHFACGVGNALSIFGAPASAFKPEAMDAPVKKKAGYRSTRKQHKQASRPQ